jgi:Zn finger protein HypA/HybF involved in hydrogenase expression
MNTEEYVGRWSAMMLEVVSGMAEWRQQHPKATLREIEMEMDLPWAYVRARMAEDLALASTAADWEKVSIDQQPHCASCGSVLQAEGGKKRRHLKTQGGQEMVLERRYGVCPTCGSRSFPPG